MSDKSEKPKRKRRRRGGLRVPSDKVPRTKSNPEIAVPESDDPHLAMSVAYAFGSGGSSSSADDLDVRDTVRNQKPAAPVDGPEAVDDFGDDRTIELDSVDELDHVEELDGEPTEAAADHPSETEAANGLPDDVRATMKVVALDEDDERTVVSGPSDIVRKPEGEAESESVDIAFDEVTPPPVALDGGARFNRARTVALSDADLEELMEGDSAPTNPFLGTSGEVAEVRIEPRSKQAKTEGVPEPRDAGDSGEIIADDMIEEIEDNAVAKAVPLVDSDALEREEPEEAEPDPPSAERKRAENSEPPPPPPAAKVKFKKQPAAPAATAKPVPPPAPAPAKPTPAAAAPADAARRRAKGKPWFEEIFDENYLRTLPFLTPQATEAESDFVLAALDLEPGAQILDVGCGYGRHSMELAARGYHVVGLDTSLPLLLRGADEAQRRGLNINFVHGDMREMQFEAQFDGAFCLFETFGYFDDETNKATAKNIARALKPGARVVLDVLNRDYLIRELPTRVWWEGDGCVVLEEVDFNYFSSRITSKRSIAFEDGRQLEQEISIRAFALHELGKLLHAAGFRVVEVSGSMHTRGRFFGAHSRDIIVVAEKRTS